MKKILAVLFSFLIVLGIAGCSTQVEYDFYQGTHSSTRAVRIGTEYVIVSEYSQIADVARTGLKKYSQDFFEDHTLIVIIDYFPMKLIGCNINRVTKNAKKITIDMQVDYADSGLIPEHPFYENYVYVEVKAKNIKEVELLGIGVESLA